jgi:hypothetical protein
VESGDVIVGPKSSPTSQQNSGRSGGGRQEIAMVTRGVRYAFIGITVGIAVAIPLQVFFAGVGVFGGGFDVHRTAGDIIVTLTILVFLLSLAGWLRRETFGPGGRGSLKVIGLALALMVVAHLQFVFIGFRGTPWVAALHALNAFAILGLAVTVIRSALAELGSRASERPPEPATHPNA